jgi:hypothetical protein
VRGAAVVLASVVTLAGCGPAPEPPEPRQLVGCHFFVQDSVARALQLPWGVRLLDEPVQGFPAIQQREGVRRATTLTGREERDFPFGYWVRTGHDTVEIGYPAGGGLRLDLVVENGQMAGHAVPVGDVVRPGAAAERPPHPVALTWARCPDE